MEPHLSRYVCGLYYYSVKLPFSTNEQFQHLLKSWEVLSSIQEQKMEAKQHKTVFGCLSQLKSVEN